MSQRPFVSPHQVASGDPEDRVGEIQFEGRGQDRCLTQRVGDVDRADELESGEAGDVLSIGMRATQIKRL